MSSDLLNAHKSCYRTGSLSVEDLRRLAVAAILLRSGFLHTDVAARTLPQPVLPTLPIYEHMASLPMTIANARVSTLPPRRRRRVVPRADDNANAIRVAGALLGLRRGCMLEGIGSAASSELLAPPIQDMGGVVLDMDGSIVVCNRQVLAAALANASAAASTIACLDSESDPSLAHACTTAVVGGLIPLPMSFSPLAAADEPQATKSAVHSLRNGHSMTMYAKQVYAACTELMVAIHGTPLGEPVAARRALSDGSVVDAVWLVGFLLQYPAVLCGVSTAPAGPALPDVSLQLHSALWTFAGTSFRAQAFSIPSWSEGTWLCTSHEADVLQVLCTTALHVWRHNMSQQWRSCVLALPDSVLALLSMWAQAAAGGPGDDSSSGGISFATTEICRAGGIAL